MHLRDSPRAELLRGAGRQRLQARVVPGRTFGRLLALEERIAAADQDDAVAPVRDHACSEGPVGAEHLERGRGGQQLERRRRGRHTVAVVEHGSAGQGCHDRAEVGEVRVVQGRAEGTTYGALGRARRRRGPRDRPGCRHRRCGEARDGCHERGRWSVPEPVVEPTRLVRRGGTAGESENEDPGHPGKRTPHPPAAGPGTAFGAGHAGSSGSWIRRGARLGTSPHSAGD